MLGLFHLVFHAMITEAISSSFSFIYFFELFFIFFFELDRKIQRETIASGYTYTCREKNTQPDEGQCCPSVTETS